MWKSRLIGISACLIAVVSCQEPYDDTAIWEKLTEIERKVTEAEATLTSLNTDISSISRLIDALNGQVYIVSVKDSDNGFLITYSDGNSQTISSGADGVSPRIGANGNWWIGNKDTGISATGPNGCTPYIGVDGKWWINGRNTGIPAGGTSDNTPIISIKADGGVYYWTITIGGQTEWLKDVGGNRIPVGGSDGITPIIRINSYGHWVVSTDGGISFREIIGKDGNAIDATDCKCVTYFLSIDYSNGILTLVLIDGTVLTINIRPRVVFNEIDCYNNIIELYNAGDHDIDMTGWVLSKNDYSEWTIPSGHSLISSKGFLVYTVYDGLFKISGKKGFILKLFDTDGNLVDELNNDINSDSFQPIGDEQTYGRKNDGSEDWVIFENGTIGTSNQNGSEHISVTGITMDDDHVELKEGESVVLSVIFIPSNATDKTVSWSSSNPAVASVDAAGIVTAVKEGKAVITATATEGAFQATCSITVIKKLYATPEAVDLGLSVKWASFNIGASAPEEYGDYFAWGEVRLKSIFDLNTYKYADNSKYNDTDKKTILDIEDDAAHEIFKGNWRIPTYEEWNELLNSSYCSWEWTSVNGTVGYLIRGKKAGFTDKSIFLPASGSKYGYNYQYLEKSGLYWSSTASGDSGCSFVFSFSNSRTNWFSDPRQYGHSIRPVLNDNPQVAVSGVTVNPASLSLYEGETKSLKASVLPSDATNQGVTWTSSDNSVAKVDGNGNVTAIKAGNATISVVTNDGGFTAGCTVTVQKKSYTVPDAVDLGLPSGLKWASFNVGASKPEEFGDYFAWGETETHYEPGYALSSDPIWKPGYEEGYLWSNYKWGINGSNKYNSEDGKTVLDPDDDAAYVKFDGLWRMPTADDFQELMDYCNWTKVERNGVIGNEVVSKVNGFTNVSIFLPAVGNGRASLSLYTQVKTRGCYASSSLYEPDSKFFRSLFFEANNKYLRSDYRYYGLVVRPVQDAVKIPVTGVSLNKTSLTLQEGASETLTATVSPSNATNKEVSWSTSNSSVATVNSSGKVIAVKAGNATITVTTTDGGKKAICSITVAPASVAVTGVSLNKASLTLQEGASETLSATVSPSNATNKAVSWSTSNSSVATVSSSGKVTAVKAGNATITVTTTDGGKKATCNVTVNAAGNNSFSGNDPNGFNEQNGEW